MSKTIDLTKVIYNRAGKPMTVKWMEVEKTLDPITNVELEEETPKSKDLTLGDMLKNALLNKNNSDLTECQWWHIIIQCSKNLKVRMKLN